MEILLYCLFQLYAITCITALWLYVGYLGPLFITFFICNCTRKISQQQTHKTDGHRIYAHSLFRLIVYIEKHALYFMFGTIMTLIFIGIDYYVALNIFCNVRTFTSKDIYNFTALLSGVSLMIVMYSIIYAIYNYVNYCKSFIVRKYNIFYLYSLRFIWFLPIIKQKNINNTENYDKFFIVNYITLAIIYFMPIILPNTLYDRYIRNRHCGVDVPLIFSEDQPVDDINLQLFAHCLDRTYESSRENFLGVSFYNTPFRRLIINSTTNKLFHYSLQMKIEGQLANNINISSLPEMFLIDSVIKIRLDHKYSELFPVNGKMDNPIPLVYRVQTNGKYRVLYYGYKKDDNNKDRFNYYDIYRRKENISFNNITNVFTICDRTYEQLYNDRICLNVSNGFHGVDQTHETQ